MSTALKLKVFESSEFPEMEEDDFNEEYFDLIHFDDDNKSLLEVDACTSFGVLDHVINCKDFTSCLNLALSQGYSLANHKSIKPQLDKISALSNADIINYLDEIDEEKGIYRYKEWQNSKEDLLSIFADLINLYKTAVENNLIVCFCI